MSRTQDILALIYGLFLGIVMPALIISAIVQDGRVGWLNIFVLAYYISSGFCLLRLRARAWKKLPVSKSLFHLVRIQLQLGLLGATCFMMMACLVGLEDAGWESTTLVLATFFVSCTLLFGLTRERILNRPGIYHS